MLDYSKRKCYGFVKNNDGEFIINEIEAQNVKLIFECFLNGMSLNEISKELHSQGISSPSGKETWSRKVLSSTLSNEKYHLHGIIESAYFEKAQVDKSSRTEKSATDESIVLEEKEVVEDEELVTISDTHSLTTKIVNFKNQITNKKTLIQNAASEQKCRYLTDFRRLNIPKEFYNFIKLKLLDTSLKKRHLFYVNPKKYFFKTFLSEILLNNDLFYERIFA